MKIEEKVQAVWLSKRELSLIKEMADEFLLNFPEADDAAALIEKITEAYHES